MKKEYVDYKSFGKCLSLSNGKTKLLITADFGPRVIFFGKDGGQNLFFEDAENSINNAGWKIYGGHRLWKSPEDKSTYEPDNRPVAFTEHEHGVSVTAPVETLTGLQKTIEIIFNGDSSVTVRHSIVNKGKTRITCALWALTVLAPGGVLTVPLKTNDTGWLPNRNLVFWPYSNISDARFALENDKFTLKQDRSAVSAFKVGTRCAAGSAVYKNSNGTFKKSWAETADAEYPDFGCSFEAYTNNLMLESETLSPLYTLEPNQSASHTEIWQA